MQARAVAQVAAAATAASSGRSSALQRAQNLFDTHILVLAFRLSLLLLLGLLIVAKVFQIRQEAFCERCHD